MPEAPPSGHEASRGSAYAALAALDPAVPQAVAGQVLLRRLAQVTHADAVRLWLPEPGQPDLLRPALAWPPQAPPVPEIPAAELARRPRTRILADDEGRPQAAVTLESRRRVTRRERRELSDTANCLMVLHRRAELQREVHDQAAYTSQLAGEVLDSSRRLAGVRDQERRRVAAEIVTFSHGRLAALQQGVEQLTPSSDVAGQVKELRTHLERLTADFQALARGIHPRVLYRHGVRAALTEMAATYPGRIRITGSIPPRVDHEVSASLYYLAAGCLHTLARSGADLEVFLGHDFLEQRASGLQVIILAWTQQSEAEVRAALAGDTDRLRHLGGRVVVSAGAQRIRVEAWVPDRLEPVARVGLVPSGNLHTRVRALALTLVARCAHSPGATPARRILNWLDEPVHVALTGLPEAGPRAQRLAELVARRPDLVSMPGGDVTTGLGADVIVRPSATAPQRCFEVHLPGVGLLRKDCEWPDLSQILTTEVVARADELRARTALAAIVRLVQTADLAVDDELHELERLVKTEDALRAG
ncbi:hypothetical protein Kisp01_26990 [Kineosporia sp. NBRC 101677]|uniref:hypothetical protein n=1 Tax=Kineosporia sp. NBRC 101677 TaxID=3032197 RepID=UPI0024A5D456|nr:hypothetical protein [Kineosporia sp. NBRC 101677]GLY15684.1 hypothetical protein Kisp01_26990 [Kineosporia sp. NBRC 101677]